MPTRLGDPTLIVAVILKIPSQMEWHWTALAILAMFELWCIDMDVVIRIEVNYPLTELSWGSSAGAPTQQLYFFIHHPFWR